MTTKDIDKDIDYDFLVDNALRGVLKIVLQSLERKTNIETATLLARKMQKNQKFLLKILPKNSVIKSISL